MYFNNLDFDWYDEMHTSQSILQPVVKLKADSLLSNDSLLHYFNGKLMLFLYNLYWKCMRPESSSCRARNSKKKVPPAAFANTAYLRR